MFTEEALALFATMAVPPDETRKELIDGTIRSLKTEEIWGLLDIFMVVDHNGTYQNWKRPSTACTVTSASGQPDIDPDRGTKGNGSAIAGVSSNLNLSTLGGNYARDSATMFVYGLTDENTTGADCGLGTGGRVFGRFSGSLIVRPNSTSNASLTVPNSCGFYGWTRNLSTHVKLFHEDTISADISNASTGISSANFSLGYAGTSASGRRILLGGAGAGLTPEKIASLRAIVYAYAAGVGAEFEANLTLDEPSGSPVTVPYRVFNNGTVVLTGTMVGSSLGIEAKVTKSSDGTTVKDWTVAASSVSTGAWSGSLTGVTAGTDYKVECRLSDLSASTSRCVCDFGVGYVDLEEGDSSGERMWRIVEAPDTAHGDVRRFSGGFPGGGAEYGGWPLSSSAKVAGERGGPYGGDGVVVLGNYLDNLIPDVSWGHLQLCTGGTDLEDYLDPEIYYDFIDYSVSNAAMLGHPTWAQIGACFMWDGVNSAAKNLSKATHKANMAAYVAARRTLTGNANLPVGFNIVGTSLGASGVVITDANLNIIRQAQLEYWDENKTDNIYISCVGIDLERVDAVGHWVRDSRCEAAARRGRCKAKMLGLVSFGAEGPRIASVAVSGNNFVVTCTLNGGTTLAGKTADTALTGSEINVDGTTRSITSCAILSATTFGGTFSGAAAASTAKYRYLYGMNPDVSNAVRDDDEIVIDALTFPGLPLQPSRDTEGDGWMAASVA